MSYMRDAVIRLGIEMQQATLQPPSYQPILEQEKRLAAMYKERAAACVSAETTIRAEYAKTAAVLREIVGLERARGAAYGGRGGGGGQIGPGLYSGAGASAGAAVGGAGIRSGSAAAMSLGFGGGGNVGSGWAGSSGRFMGQYGNYSPTGPAGPTWGGSQIMGSSASRFGGSAAWMMGTYGDYTPTAPAADPRATARAAAMGGRYDALNSQFNTGNAFWDRARNRFGYGPFDAVGNQLRGWGGAVGAGLGAYGGSAFGDMGMIAGAATGQMVGQGVGYMATTGVGRQMLLRGAEAVATSGFGRGIAGGLAGAAAYSGAGLLGAGAAYSAGAVALPFAAAGAVGYAGNRAVTGIGNSFTNQWIQANSQDNWNRNFPQTQLMRSQERFAAMDRAIAAASNRFGVLAGSQSVGFGQDGFAAADAFASQRGRMNAYLTDAVSAAGIARRLAMAPEQVGSALGAAESGIQRRKAIIANIGTEISFRQQGVAQIAAAESRLQSANMDVQSERARIRGAEAAMGGAGAKEKGEFWRITSAIQSGARVNVEDLAMLESVAGQDNRVKDYVERERRKFYREENFGRRLDELFGKGDTDLLEAIDRRDEAQKEFDKASPDGRKSAEALEQLNTLIEGLTKIVEKHQSDIEALENQAYTIKNGPPG